MYVNVTIHNSLLQEISIKYREIADVSIGNRISRANETHKTDMSGRRLALLFEC